MRTQTTPWHVLFPDYTERMEAIACTVYSVLRAWDREGCPFTLV